MTRRLLMILLLLASPAAAQPVDSTPAHRCYGEWRSSHIGGGGYLQRVVACPSNAKRLYLGVDVGGLYRSDDAGGTWQMLHGQLPARAGSYSVAGISVDPTNADHLCIATGSVWAAPEGIYLSADAGRTWKPTLQGVRFAGDGQQRAAGPVIVRDPADPRRLLAGSAGQGIYRSQDAGQTWDRASDIDACVLSIAFDRSRPGRALASAAPLARGSEAQIALSRKSAGLYQSDDAGATWQRWADDAPRQLVQDPREPSRWYGTFSEKTIHVSDDAGRTWKPFGEGLPAYAAGSRSPGRFNAVASGPDFVIAGATDGAVYKLAAGAKAWERVEPIGIDEADWFARLDGPAGGRHFGSAMGFIDVDPHDPARWRFTDWYAHYQTNDAGKHWKLAIDGVEATVIHCVRGVPGKPAMVHMGMADNGYFRSDDGAATFAYRSNGGISNNVKDISVAPANPDRVYAVSTDTFKWWANQVFISDDAGSTWRRSKMRGLPDMQTARCNTIAAAHADADHVLLAVSGKAGPGAGGAYLSTDAGQNWTWIGQGLPADVPLFREGIWTVGREIATDREGHLVAISHDTGRLFRAERAGAVWQETRRANPMKPNDLIADPLNAKRFYIADKRDGVLASIDAGATWSQIYPNPAHHLAIDPTDPTRIAAATDDGVVLSRDAGRTWTPLDARLPYRVARLPLSFAGSRLVVGTAGCGVFWIDLSTAPTR